MPARITNPIAQFHLEGDPDDPDGVVAVATFFSEDGGQVEMRFTRPGESGAIAEMLWECALDLHEGQTEGIMAVVARKGEAPADEEPLTVAQILEAAEGFDPESPFNLPMQPPTTSFGITYPWQIHDLGDGITAECWEDPPWECRDEDHD